MKATHCSMLAAGVFAFVAASLAAPRAQPRAIPVGPGLTAPPGFTVEQVAGPPLVNRPIVADFDDEGRLYVADSSGSNDKVDKQLADKPHRIVRLEDTDGDGRFDSSTVFADKMMFPEGAMWLDGSLYVAAPPSIWKLTDTDGDGVADRREEWFQGKTLTGCANDLHGPYLGPDGWIYWTKGAFAEQTYDRPGKPPLVTRASHILRRRPGSASIEIVMTGGMDNPVDVAFTETGERILSATFVEHPQLGRRDGLLHAIYGGVYGKQHAVIDGHKRTGDLMPILAQLGPAVPAGLTRYASRAFGEAFHDNFFGAMFNMRKVTRHVLEPSGATFTIRDTDFLVSDNRDFHPTDVIEDADGSLLVIDTGPWYKLCCPTSQLAKPEVLGGIYRVRRTGASAIRDPRGRMLPWQTMAPAALVGLLNDSRPAVQNRAVRQLASRGDAAIPALDEAVRHAISPDARRNGVWALTRMDGAQARATVRLALGDRDESVRHAAIHSAGLWRDAGSMPLLDTALKSGPPSIQRPAAEALGRIGDPRAVPDLLVLAASAVDRVLEHSITYALIEINDPSATAASVQQAPASRSRRAALIALDQMDNGSLVPEQIVALLDSTDPVLNETAWWIAGHHPEWGGALATFFERHLAAAGTARADRNGLEQKLAQFSENLAIQGLLATLVERAPSKEERLTALRVMTSAAGTRLKVLPTGWIAPLVDALAGEDGEVAAQALAVIRAVPAPKEGAPELRSALLRAGRDTTRPTELRLHALAAITDGLTPVGADLFELLETALGPRGPVSLRSTAAAIIEKATLDDIQLLALTASVRTAGPLELPRLLRAYGNGSEAAGLAMIAALRESASRASVRADLLRPVLVKYPDGIKKEAENLLASLDVDAAEQARRLEALLPALQGGDVGRGQAVFNSEKAACYGCHAIGYMGGRIGPDLTRIGQVRSERDLLEAVVFPNASFARGYEPVVIRTRSGDVRWGVLKSNDQVDEVVLATAVDETRIPRRDIVEMEPGAVSLMPQGFAEQLTKQELADLLAFLKATRSGAN